MSKPTHSSHPIYNLLTTEINGFDSSAELALDLRWSWNMHDLLERETKDVRAAEAVALICYQVKKWIGAFTTALGGLDTLVFASGIGENTPTVHARICDGLGFLGVELNKTRNVRNLHRISPDTGRGTVRVMHTDEWMIAKTVCRVPSLGPVNEKRISGRSLQREVPSAGAL